MDRHSNVPPNLENLATLLVLQDQIKHLKTLKEFGYFATNETHRLFFYNTAYLWKKEELLGIQLLDQSEIAEVDLQAPISQWMHKWIAEILKTTKANEIQAINFERSNGNKEASFTVQKTNSDLETEERIKIDDELMRAWPISLPFHVLWSPFLNDSKEISGGLIIFRDTPFTAQEIKMYTWLANNYQYTWEVLTRSKLSIFYKWYKSKVSIKVITLLGAILIFFPIRLSLTASATVESSNPVSISAPVPGIIDKFLVKPGDTVKKGQILVELDKTDYIKSLAVIHKKVMLSETKLRSVISQGYDNPAMREEIQIIQGQLAIDQADEDYAKMMLDKTDIKSPIDGVAVFESKEDWVGQPVQPGETIINIADVGQTQLKIFVPVPDIIPLEVGAKGKFYVYGQLTEIPIVLSSYGYNAKFTQNKILAYEFIAQFVDPDTAPRIGIQGTARLYNGRVPLIYYLLRRPLNAIRQSIDF